MSRAGTDVYGKPQFSLPIIGAIVVHVIVFGLLLGSWSLSFNNPKQFEIPKHIRAEMVVLEKPKPVKPKAEPKVEAKPEPKPKPKPIETPKPKPVIQPKPEPKPVEVAPEPVPDAVNISKETKPAEVEPAKEDVAVEPEVEPTPVEVVPTEDLFADLLADMAAEDEAIQDQIAAIEQSQARDAEIQAQVSDYIVVITQQVEEKWSRPVELRLMDLSNIEAAVSVEILPTGELQSASISRSSGNENYDQSVLRAIEKVRRFTVPQDSEVFEAGGFRNLNIIFRPEDLMKP